MHLSYNVIKENRTIAKESKKITTESIVEIKSDEVAGNINSVTLEEAQAYISNYERLGQNIIEDAKRKRDEYIYGASEKAAVIEREAYEKGYTQGIANGEEDGRKKAYESCIPEATKEAEEIILKAEKILASAQDMFESYLEEKKKEIIELSVSIAEQILKREVTDKASINGLVEEAIKLSKGEENVVIRCNPMYEEELQKQIPVWKTLNNILGEIFVLVDDSMECGNAVVEKKTGKIIVGLDIGLERIKEAIL